MAARESGVTSCAENLFSVILFLHCLISGEESESGHQFAPSLFSFGEERSRVTNLRRASSPRFSLSIEVMVLPVLRERERSLVVFSTPLRPGGLIRVKNPFFNQEIPSLRVGKRPALSLPLGAVGVRRKTRRGSRKHACEK